MDATRGVMLAFNDAELEAVTEILSRAIEPHSCAEGTPWWPAFRAWVKCAEARGTLNPEDDLS